MMYYLLEKYKGKSINVFTKHGAQGVGTLVEIVPSGSGEFAVVMSDRWSSKHYFTLSDISHFWCDDDKPTDD